MDPITERWASVQAERMTAVQSVPDPTALSPACGGLRIRREYAARDAINSRAWDFFHATPPTQTSSANMIRRSATDGAPPVYMDMNPIASRTNTVQYRLQPDYMPDPVRKPMTDADLGVAPAAAAPSLPPPLLSENYYTQRLDAGGFDSRNMIRELRSAVVEDNRERQVDASRLLAQRQFYDRWMPPVTATDASALQAYELLRPKSDDWRSSNP